MAFAVPKRQHHDCGFFSQMTSQRPTFASMQENHRQLALKTPGVPAGIPMRRRGIQQELGNPMA